MFEYQIADKRFNIAPLDRWTDREIKRLIDSGEFVLEVYPRKVIKGRGTDIAVAEWSEVAQYTLAVEGSHVVMAVKPGGTPLEMARATLKGMDGIAKLEEWKPEQIFILNRTDKGALEPTEVARFQLNELKGE